ncbi:uncharacterized [Tachysurus ichikawai]
MLKCRKHQPQKAPRFSRYPDSFVVTGLLPRQHKDSQAWVSDPVTTAASPAHVYVRVLTVSHCVRRPERHRHQSCGVNKADFDPDY